MHVFGGAFQPQQRISRTCLQSAAEQDAQEPASPAAGETQMAMVVDPAPPVLQRNAVQRLVNRQAKWKPRVQLQPVMRRVDEGVFDGETKMQPAGARLTGQALPLAAGPGGSTLMTRTLKKLPQPEMLVSSFHTTPTGASTISVGQAR